MRSLIRTSIVLVAACMGIASSGCSAGPAPAKSAQAVSSPNANPNPSPGDTLGRIRALVGTPSCSDDSQCHSLALGARPCGGPESWLPWSSQRTPPDTLRALADTYKAEREAANRASGLMGTCQFQPDPGAVCKAGTCQPNSQAPLPM